MKRIDTATKAVDLFGAGKHGFQDGNPSLGVPATQLTAALFNNVQEEIARVVEAAGITLDGSVYTQLLSALTAGWNLPKLVAGDGYIKLPGGIIIQWGTIAGGSGVTFPVAFPTATLRVIHSRNTTTGNNAVIGSTSTTGFTLSTAYAIDWLAIGY